MEGEPPSASRFLLKLSGELLAAESGKGLSPPRVDSYAAEIAAILTRGHQFAVVVGGGNFIRGRELQGFGAVPADYMGMIATVINAVALGDAVERAGGRATVLSALPVQGIAESFDPIRASELMGSGTAVLCGGGTGNPMVTTDTAAALRAVQTGCDMLLKGTKVDGVYDSDPETSPNARRFDRLSYDEVIRKRLGVMDLPAIAICRDADLPVVVFDAWSADNVSKAVSDPTLGTVIDRGNES
ncbi:UMP kinase [Candidatus Fermentibacteria bacterium]|nr:UMP kinase [Candidatus Fermentibacteria bacterium]